MKRILLILLALSAMVVLFTAPALASSVTIETVSANTNIITDPNGANAKETINNIDPWLKYVTFGNFNPDSSGDADFNMTFDITNNTGFTWADYHFSIVETLNFNYNGVNYPISVNFSDPASSNDFKGNIPDPASGTYLTFFYDPPGSKYIDPGDDLGLGFKISMSGFPTTIPSSESISYTFTIEQQPSLVPLPPSVLLLGSGLLGLGLLGGGFRRKRKGYPSLRPETTEAGSRVVLPFFPG